MDSTSIYKYRIKQHWTVNSLGSKECNFYPQYKSILFGWRFLNKYPWNNLNVMFNFAVLMSTVIFGMIFIGSFVFLITNVIKVYSGLLISPPLIYITLFLFYRYNREDVKVCESVDEAKEFISKRVSYLEENRTKKKKIKLSEDELPNNKVFYLNLQVERTEKLKKLKWKSKFKFLYKIKTFFMS